MVYVPPEVISTAITLVSGGQNPRRGGADPCCPPGYDPSGVWPRNSNVDGAPPDYRSRGAPMESPSPSGTGRLKDDFCDCIPISYNGRLFVLGEVRDGKVYTGPPQNRDEGVWVEVTRTGAPVRVPGVGAVGSGAGEPSGGGAPTTTGADFPPLTAGVGGGLTPLLFIGAAFLAWRAFKS